MIYESEVPYTLTGEVCKGIAEISRIGAAKADGTRAGRVSGKGARDDMGTSWGRGQGNKGTREVSLPRPMGEEREAKGERMGFPLPGKEP